ncbi:hypothetical protein TNCV_4152231 [Trichonephila clavipes]|nr:hypothetical protein TNCV_4152231 [Trichonephila clavipes]
MNDKHRQQIGTTFLLTNPASPCNITKVGFKFGGSMVKGCCCVMHRHTGPAPGIIVWGGIGFHCRTPLKFEESCSSSDEIETSQSSESSSSVKYYKPQHTYDDFI